jgi:CRP-like cAMP-binding protein
MTLLPKGTIVQTPYDENDGIYFVKEGKLKLYRLNEEGKQFTLGVIGSGNSFGNTKLFSLGTQNAYIETIEEALVCLMKNNELELFLLNRPHLLMNILKNLSLKLEEQNHMLEELALYDLRHRVLFWIRKLAKEFGIDHGKFITIDLSLSQQELANMVGSSRESVSIVLSNLETEGIILTERLKISIHRNHA